MSNETIALDSSKTRHLHFPKQTSRFLASQDISDGLKQWRVWLMLAYQDIKIRYRRSVLGPFWITLSMAITVYSMGYLYGHLFRSDLASYYPFLVAGMLAWTLISGSILDLIDTLVASEVMIKQIKLPYSLYIHRVATRNILIFFHNILVMVPVYFIFFKTAKINFNTLFLIPGLLIIYLNALTYGLVLGIIGARYRDVSQIVKSFIQVVFFLTPVMWKPDVLPANKIFIVKYNPFCAFIEMVRAPLIGYLPTGQDFAMVFGISLLGIILCYKMFIRYRARIVYWL